MIRQRVHASLIRVEQNKWLLATALFKNSFLPAVEGRTSPSRSSPFPGRWPSAACPLPTTSILTFWTACTPWAASETRTNCSKTCFQMSEWPGRREGRLEDGMIEARWTSGQSRERENTWGGVENSAVTNGKIKVAMGWGCVGVPQKVCGVENLGFSPLMKSREAVALDVTDYRSLNPDLTALPNWSRPAANPSLWVTLFLFCSSSNLRPTYTRRRVFPSANVTYSVDVHPADLHRL